MSCGNLTCVIGNLTCVGGNFSSTRVATWVLWRWLQHLLGVSNICMSCSYMSRTVCYAIHFVLFLFHDEDLPELYSTVQHFLLHDEEFFSFSFSAGPFVSMVKCTRDPQTILGVSHRSQNLGSYHLGPWSTISDSSSPNQLKSASTMTVGRKYFGVDLDLNESLSILCGSRWQSSKFRHLCGTPEIDWVAHFTLVWTYLGCIN